MIDIPEYSHNAFNKMELYAQNNIYPNINLITTFETYDQPITPSEIDEVIRRFFL